MVWETRGAISDTNALTQLEPAVATVTFSVKRFRVRVSPRQVKPLKKSLAKKGIIESERFG